MNFYSFKRWTIFLSQNGDAWWAHAMPKSGIGLYSYSCVCIDIYLLHVVVHVWNLKLHICSVKVCLYYLSTCFSIHLCRLWWNKPPMMLPSKGRKVLVPLGRRFSLRRMRILFVTTISYVWVSEVFTQIRVFPWGWRFSLFGDFKPRRIWGFDLSHLFPEDEDSLFWWFKSQRICRFPACLWLYESAGCWLPRFSCPVIYGGFFYLCRSCSKTSHGKKTCLDYGIPDFKSPNLATCNMLSTSFNQSCFRFMALNNITNQFIHIWLNIHTVDGWNPAPVDR